MNRLLDWYERSKLVLGIFFIVNLAALSVVVWSQNGIGWIDGYVEEGRYYVSNHGTDTEVSRFAWYGSGIYFVVFHLFAGVFMLVGFLAERRNKKRCG